MASIVLWNIGNLFLTMQEDLENGEEVAQCPSCSLIIRVIYDPVRETH